MVLLCSNDEGAIAPTNSKEHFLELLLFVVMGNKPNLGQSESAP